MGRGPLSNNAKKVLAFIKAHPGVQAKYVVLQLKIDPKDFAVAMTVLHGRRLVSPNLDLRFNKRENIDDRAIRWFAKV
jgi:hypothetical protein